MLPGQKNDNKKEKQDTCFTVSITENIKLFRQLLSFNDKLTHVFLCLSTFSI